MHIDRNSVDQALQEILDTVSGHISSANERDRSAVHLKAVKQITDWTYGLFDHHGPVYGKSEQGQRIQRMEASLDSQNFRKPAGRLQRWGRRVKSLFTSQSQKSSRVDDFTSMRSREPSIFQTMADEEHDAYLAFRDRQVDGSVDLQYRGRIAKIVEESIAAAKAKDTSSANGLDASDLKDPISSSFTADTAGNTQSSLVSITVDTGDKSYSLPVPDTFRGDKMSKETFATLAKGLENFISQQSQLSEETKSQKSSAFHPSCYKRTRKRLPKLARTISAY